MVSPCYPDGFFMACSGSSVACSVLMAYSGHRHKSCMTRVVGKCDLLHNLPFNAMEISCNDQTGEDGIFFIDYYASCPVIFLLSPRFVQIYYRDINIYFIHFCVFPDRFIHSHRTICMYCSNFTSFVHANFNTIRISLLHPKPNSEILLVPIK